MDARGRDFTPSFIRKIEGLFWREETRLAGEIFPRERSRPLIPAYREWLLDRYPQGEKKLSFSLLCPEGPGRWLERIFSKAGFKLMANAPLKMVVDRNWEEWQMIYQGQPLTAPQQQALLAWAFFELLPEEDLIVPLTASHIVEMLADSLGRKAVRVKSHPGLWQEALASPGRGFLASHWQLDTPLTLLALFSLVAGAKGERDS